MRNALICLLAAGSIISSFATDARVESMGWHDAFFIDEESIFRNPANVNIYPNMVYGSYGKFNYNDTMSYLSDPFFGAIVSYSLNENAEANGQYPMLSIGAFFNRPDQTLGYLSKGSDMYLGSVLQTEPVPPLGKVDLIVGYVLKNGTMIGGSAFLAAQDIQDDGDLTESKIYKGNLGISWPVAKTMDMEASMSLGLLTAYTPTNQNKIADQDIFGRIEMRLFSALAGINGDFVPRVRVDLLQIEKTDLLKVDIAAGLGVNINIDKGFFWTGLEFLYGQKDSNNESIQEAGGRVSFGIERSIWKDWFVLRVGGQKSMMIKTEGPEKSIIVENPEYKMQDKDLVSLGIGLNVENRLKVDFVMSELFPYTFTNLISSGQQQFLFSRVSATYSF